MIRPWVFEFFPELSAPTGGGKPSTVPDYFSSYLSLWEKDEKFGFEGIFFSEHHFGSYSPSPNLLIAAVAQRTRTLRLGVMGVVTPNYQPWRIVEEIGMLDNITGGRLEIGTAIGIPPELAALNITMDEARGRNDEALEILDAALTQEVISYHGKYYNFDNLRPLPRPCQLPRPPVWTTIVSAGSAIKAAQRGSKICTGFNSTAEIKTIFDAYREASDRSGLKAGPEHLALRRRVAIAETESEAQELLEGVTERLRNTLAKDPRASLKAVPDAPQKGTGFSLSEDEFISGTPDRVLEQIIHQCKELGAGHFLAVIHWGAPYDDVARGHELFAKINPELRRAAI